MQDKSFEIYSQMLASEGISMIFSDTEETAYFDVKRRIIVMPKYNFLGETENQLLASHEVGHALFSKYSMDDFHKNTETYGPLFNILEDAYIEGKIKSRFPGLHKIFKEGYKTLFDNGFFGKNLEEKVRNMHFYDRINLFFKVGHCLNVPFSQEEKAFIAKIYSLSSNKDVVNLCQKIKKFAENNDNSELPLINPVNINDSNGGAAASSVSASEDSEDNPSDSASEDNPSEENKNQDADTNKDSDEDNGSGTDNGSDTNKDSDEDNGSGTDNGSDTNKDSDEDDDEDEFYPGNTYDSLSRMLDDNLKQDRLQREAQEKPKPGDSYCEPFVVYLSLRENPTSNFVEDFRQVSFDAVQELKRLDADKKSRDLFNKLTIGYQLELHQFLEDMKENINSLKELSIEGDSYFKRLRNARKMKDTKYRITGKLDSRRLSQYKTAETIFKKKLIRYHETNHGVILFIDYSGSMSLNMVSEAIFQAIIICEFCKRNSIRFEAYLFGAETMFDKDHAGSDKSIFLIVDSEHYTPEQLYIYIQ